MLASRLIVWLRDVWFRYLGDEHYEAHVNLPIEDVWERFREACNSSKRVRFWEIQNNTNNIAFSLSTDYEFQAEPILTVGAYRSGGSGWPPAQVTGKCLSLADTQTLIKYCVRLRTEKTSAISSLFIGALIFGIALTVAIVDFSLGSFVAILIAAAGAYFLVVISFSLAHQSKKDLLSSFRQALGVHLETSHKL